MSNWKHTVAALGAVATVVSLTAAQMSGVVPVMADKNESEAAVSAADVTVELPPVETQQAEAEPESEATEFEVKTGYIIYSDGSVNVREQASREALIISSLRAGNSFEVTAQEGDWYAITLPDGKSGYVMCDLVSFDFDEVRDKLLSTTMFEKGTVSVSGGALNVRNAPSDSETVVIGQLADGAEVYIIEKQDNGWYKIYFGDDYETGYAMSDYIMVGDMVSRDEVLSARNTRLNSAAKKGVIVMEGSYVNVRNAPSENADIISTLKNGDSCSIISQGNKWTKISFNSGVAYITASAVMDAKAYEARKAAQAAETEAKKAASATPAPKKEQAQQTAKKAKAETKTTAKSETPAAAPAGNVNGSRIVKEAEKYIGTKYVYGGSSPAGFDCSGLVQYTMKKVGISVNRSSRDQYKNGVAVSKSDLQAGDLVFFSKGGSISHVGIYAGGGKVIHSPRPGQSVCYTTLDHMCSYSTFVGARRVY